MKKLLLVFASLWFVGHAALGCAEVSPRSSMKGWELYSWQVDNDWYFSLLPGTNRLKGDDEIVSSAVKGVDAAKNLLNQIGVGESVLWTAYGTGPGYTNGLLEDIRSHCKRRGLDLRVAEDWYQRTRLLKQ